MGEPQRGDIVTFHRRRTARCLIKRLVAVPGDVVEMRDEQLIINGRGADYRVVEESIELDRQGEALHAVQLASRLHGHAAPHPGAAAMHGRARDSAR